MQPAFRPAFLTPTRSDGYPPHFDVVVYPAPHLEGELRAQPSKNYTTRYLLAAALCEGQTRVVGIASSEDAQAMLTCLAAWGAGVERVGDDAVIRGFGAQPRAGVSLNPGNAGAVARFLMGVAALTEGTTFVTDYPDSLGKRPQGDLLEALTRLGVQVSSASGKFPIQISGPVRQQPSGHVVEVSAEQSSQYASALIFLGPLLPGGLELHLTGNVKSHAPLRQTLDTLRAFGVQASASADLRRISVPGGQRYQPGRVLVPGDYPGSAALMVAAALCGGEVKLSNLRQNDLQGEKAAVEVLRGMGADITRAGDTITVRGGLPLKAVTHDGDGFTDAVQALCAAAAFAQGQTTWENVATLRLKECDRISDTCAELSKLGLQVSETPSSLSIVGAPHLAGGLTLSGRGDHRMIMLLTLLGLRAQAPIVITGAHHIRKSYPLFFRHLETLGAKFDYVPSDRP